MRYKSVGAPICVDKSRQSEQPTSFDTDQNFMISWFGCNFLINAPILTRFFRGWSLECADFLGDKDARVISGFALYRSVLNRGFSVLGHIKFWCWELTGRGALPRVLFIQAATGRDVQQVSLFHFKNATWSTPFSQSHLSVNIKYIVIKATVRLLLTM